MKKLFSIFAALLFAGSMMAAVGNVFYTLEFKKTDGNSAYASYFDITSNGMQWNAPGNMTQGDFDRIGGKGSLMPRAITSKDAMGDAISQIVITHNGGNRKEIILDSIAVTIASDAAFTEDVVVEQYAQHLGTGSVKIAAGTITLSPTADYWAKDSYYKVTLFVSNSSSSNGGLDVVSLAFYSYQDPNAPAINAANVQLDAGLTKDGNYSTTAELVVTGANLTDAITVTDGTYTTAEGTLTAAGGTLQLTFTVSAEGEYADHITLTSGSTSVEVPVTAKVIQTTGIGTKTDPLTVADVIKINNATSLSNKYWVAGYIVGCAANNGTIGDDAATNLALGATADQTENVLPVELPSGAIRTALNLVDNSSNKGKQIKVHGVLQMYFNFTGVKSVDDYEFIAAAPAPEIEASKTTIDFGTVEVGAKGPDDNAYLQETFTLTGTNLTGDVRIEATTTGGGSIFTTNGYRAVATLSPTDGAINSTIYAIAATGFAGTFNGLLTISSDAGDFENFTVALSIVVVEPTKYYLKNNWGGGDWTWQQTTKVNDNEYKLENVVFGGTGVNVNTAASDEGSSWIAHESFNGNTIKALDTVTLTYVVSSNSISAILLGSYVAPADPTWTVAGSSAAAFGTTWAADNADNDMVKQSDGTFLWERTGLVLAAGSVNFKVCRDHAWTVAYPSSDYSLAISADGIYTITITFDPSTNTVSATATKTGDAVVTPVIELKGSWNAAGAYDATWNGGAAYPFVESGAVATYTVNFTETGTYELGLQVNGAWTANGATITRTAPGTDLDNGGTGNMHLVVDVVGEYEFIWTYAVNNLTVMFPDEPVAGCDWDNLEWLGDGSAEQTFGNQFKVCKAGAQPNVVNIQTAPWANNNTGIYINFPDAVIGNISLAEGQYKIEGAGILLFLSAFTAKETEVTVEWQNGVYEFTVFNAKGVATGIENNAVVEKAVKFIENGQLFIIKNGVKYNAQGAVVR